MSLARKGALALAATLIGLVLVTLVFHQYVRGAAFVIQASGMRA